MDKVKTKRGLSQKFTSDFLLCLQMLCIKIPSLHFSDADDADKNYHAVR